MRRRKNRIAEDINLTPLLDVLFVILFIFMLTSTQNEKTLQAEAADSQTEIADLEQQIDVLQSQVDNLNHENHLLESNKMTADHVTVITIENSIDGNNQHILTFYKGYEKKYFDKIFMGKDRQQYIRDNVKRIVEKVLKETTDEYPVCIFFYWNPDVIYEKEEFDPIDETLKALKTVEKSVFYQCQKR